MELIERQPAALRALEKPSPIMVNLCFAAQTPPANLASHFTSFRAKSALPVSDTISYTNDAHRIVSALRGENGVNAVCIGMHPRFILEALAYCAKFPTPSLVLVVDKPHFDVLSQLAPGIVRQTGLVSYPIDVQHSEGLPQFLENQLRARQQQRDARE